jgi:hypothetical protein
MSFKPTSSKYAVPIPLDLDPSNRARWVTDVIVMDPVCTWAVPDPPLAVPADMNPNNTYTTDLNITLPAYEVGAKISVSYLREWL